MSGLDKGIEGLELSIEELLKLLGGDSEARWRFYEVVKGITTPAEYRLVESAIGAAERQVATVLASLAAVHGVANETRIS